MVEWEVWPVSPPAKSQDGGVGSLACLLQLRLKNGGVGSLASVSPPAKTQDGGCVECVCLSPEWLA